MPPKKTKPTAVFSFRTIQSCQQCMYSTKNAEGQPTHCLAEDKDVNPEDWEGSERKTPGWCPATDADHYHGGN